MLVDLTDTFRTLGAGSVGNNQPLAPSKAISMSANSKLYATHSENIHKMLLRFESVLESSRENYFSNASYSFQAFSDRQREELNQQVRDGLAEISMQVKGLGEGLNQQQLFKSKTEKEHMKAVVLCLYQFYKRVELNFKQFETFSKRRKLKAEQTIALERPALALPPRTNTKANFPPPSEQLEREAHMLFVEKVGKQKELEAARVQLENINELMANMSNIVLEQELKSSAFLQIGQTGLFHIDRGNKNLIQANILAKETGKWWSMLFLAMAFSLLVLDCLKS